MISWLLHQIVYKLLNQQASNSATLQAAAAKQISMIQKITLITALQLPVNGSQQVQTSNLDLTIARASIDTITSDLEISNCQVDVSDPCSIVGQSKGNCSETIVVSQVLSRKNSLVLNQDLNTQGSIAVGLTFYDNNMNLYTVSNVDNGFYFWISVSIEETVEFTVFNSTNTTINSVNQLQAFTMKMSSANQAVTVLLSPSETNSSTGYLICLKYGQAPVVNSSVQIFDSIQVYCPWDLQLLEGRQSYKMFSNIAANKISATTVGYGFRKLTDEEYAEYCHNGVTKTMSLPHVLTNSYNFSSLVSDQVSRMIFASGCYYLDETTMTYSSAGVEVLSDSNSTHTHCVSRSLDRVRWWSHHVARCY